MSRDAQPRAHGAGRRPAGHRLLPGARSRITPLFVLAPLFSADRSRAGQGRRRGRARNRAHRHRDARPAHPGEPLPVAGLLVVNLLVGLLVAFAIVRGMSPRSRPPAGSPTPCRASRSAPPSTRSTATRAARLPSLWPRRRDAVHRDRRGRLDPAGARAHVHLVPLTKAPQIGPLAGAGAETACVSIFVLALEVAAPAIMALLITDVAFGMVSQRRAPDERVVGRVPAQGRRRAGRGRRDAAVPRRLAAGPDLHVGRHRPQRPLDRHSHGRSRQDRKADSQAQDRGAQGGAGRQEPRPQRFGGARGAGWSG